MSVNSNDLTGSDFDESLAASSLEALPNVSDSEVYNESEQSDDKLDLSDEEQTSDDSQFANDCDELESNEDEKANFNETDSEDDVSEPKKIDKSDIKKRSFGEAPIRGARRNFGVRAPFVNQMKSIRPNFRKNVPQRYNSNKAPSDAGSMIFVSNWGHRSNLIDQNGNFQRATTDLKNYIVYYKAKYYYYFDLVNGRYPQFVRKFQNNLEIWRMSFNVYASGFSDYIAHLGEIHAFYQMEPVNNKLRWVYKDFNFYPNKMRYGFRVNSYDIADVHSRFVKFVCLRDSIIKQFPYVNIKHKVFIFRKFDENLRAMMSRLNQVKMVENVQPSETVDEEVNQENSLEEVEEKDNETTAIKTEVKATSISGEIEKNETILNSVSTQEGDNRYNSLSSKCKDNANCVSSFIHCR